MFYVEVLIKKMHERNVIKLSQQVTVTMIAVYSRGSMPSLKIWQRLVL